MTWWEFRDGKEVGSHWTFDWRDSSNKLRYFGVKIKMNGPLSIFTVLKSKRSEVKLAGIWKVGLEKSVHFHDRPFSFTWTVHFGLELTVRAPNFYLKVLARNETIQNAENKRIKWLKFRTFGAQGEKDFLGSSLNSLMWDPFTWFTIYSGCIKMHKSWKLYFLKFLSV